MKIFFEKVGKRIRKFFEVWSFLLYLFNFIFYCVFSVCVSQPCLGGVSGTHLSGDAPNYSLRKTYLKNPFQNVLPKIRCSNVAFISFLYFTTQFYHDFALDLFLGRPFCLRLLARLVWRRIFQGYFCMFLGYFERFRPLIFVFQIA